jgi:hypothetical protein
LDVVCAVPYLVGYPPIDELVVLAIRDGLLRSTLHLGLPTGDDLPLLVLDLALTLRDRFMDAAIVAGYGEPDTVDPVLRALGQVLDGIDVRVCDLLRVHEGRYWSLLRCDWASDSAGTPFDVASSQIAAEATLAGMSYLPSRAAYEAQVRLVPAVRRQGMAAASARVVRHLVGPDGGQHRIDAALNQPDPLLVRAGVAALDRGLRTCEERRPLSDDDIAALSVTASCPAVLGLAWDRIDNEPDRAVHQDLWREVFCRAERGFTAAAGCLFANAAWRHGELLLARLAVQRVLDEHPEHHLAMLMLTALNSGLPHPGTLR